MFTFIGLFFSAFVGMVGATSDTKLVEVEGDGATLESAKHDACTNAVVKVAEDILKLKVDEGLKKEVLTTLGIRNNDVISSGSVQTNSGSVCDVYAENVKVVDQYETLVNSEYVIGVDVEVNISTDKLEHELSVLKVQFEKLSKAGVDVSTIDFTKFTIEQLIFLTKGGKDLSLIDFTKFTIEQLISIQPLLKALTVKTISAGRFTMGCTRTLFRDCPGNETPFHEVTISKDFLMMESEVTQELYETVMGSNSSRFKGENRPVENVSWIDAVTFANRLSELDGRVPCYSMTFGDVEWLEKPCTGWRLPTEAEWEYAARGGEYHKYSASNSVNEVAWYVKNSDGETHDVCGKTRNGYGLCDMSGNVYEWIWDIYGGYSSRSQTDPTGPYTGPNRVFRGGSSGNGAMRARVSYRGNCDPTRRFDYLGFRLVRTP